MTERKWVVADNRRDVCANGHRNTPENTIMERYNRDGEGRRRPRCRQCQIDRRARLAERRAMEKRRDQMISAFMATGLVDSGVARAMATDIAQSYGLRKAVYKKNDR